jgi:hypothetical protein
MWYACRQLDQAVLNDIQLLKKTAHHKVSKNVSRIHSFGTTTTTTMMMMMIAEIKVKHVIKDAV